MQVEQSDVIVVGAGAAASALLPRLLARGLSVTVIERGEVYEPPPLPQQSQPRERYTTPLEDLPNLTETTDGSTHLFLVEGKTTGGATAVFAGNLLRFHESDFRRRSLLGPVAGANVADWPLSYAELETHYTELEREIGVAGDARANPFEPWRSAPYSTAPLQLDAAGGCAHAGALELGWHPYAIPSAIDDARCVRCGTCTGYACGYRARWHAGIALARIEPNRYTLRTGQTVTRIVMDRDGDRAVGVEHIDAEGRLFQTRGRAIVMAANAMQTPRILLQSATPRHPQGLANDSGLVGRNLLTHAHSPLLVYGSVANLDATRSVSCTLAIQDFYENDFGVGITLQPRALGPVLRSANSGDRAAPVSATTLIRDHVESTPNLAVVLLVEDLAQVANGLTLSPDRKDRHGLPVPIVHYHAHDHDRRATKFAAQKAADLLAASGAEDIEYADWNVPRYYTFGTCRMGDDPDASVVDSHGRSHRIRNLFVADGSLFVSSSGVNPALTVMALARRVADGLVASFAARDL
jgi:choline dehydrogenase-like flavoprotein